MNKDLQKRLKTAKRQLAIFMKRLLADDKFTEQDVEKMDALNKELTDIKNQAKENV